MHRSIWTQHRGCTERVATGVLRLHWKRASAAMPRCWCGGTRRAYGPACLSALDQSANQDEYWNPSIANLDCRAWLSGTRATPQCCTARWSDRCVGSPETLRSASRWTLRPSGSVPNSCFLESRVVWIPVGKPTSPTSVARPAGAAADRTPAAARRWRCASTTS